MRFESNDYKDRQDMAMQNKEHQKHYISERKPCWYVCENLGEIF